ncbi:gastrula zinc finger protein XlCGF57.1-like [Cheilinus undulatus]|uniref:gastrula zinc finger protein XlCGF57.1-like n=1 Tax=Cheilinus undulatus TaxID=241271 RepID=UPI001BD6A583|nr:gastrula zinc finger protein XlCGF57.1-like [Cheilinus undulatus]
MFRLQDGSVFPKEVQRFSMSREEVSPEEQESSSGLDQEIIIKKEPEDLWGSQHGEQLQGPEEDDIIKFTYFPVPLKSEDNEIEPHSSQHNQRQTEEIETGDDGEDCGGEEEAGFSDSELPPEIEVKIEYSSGAETDDSGNWRETREHQTDPNLLESMTDEKLHCCSVCGKTFNWKGRLRRHMLVHTGEKPYSCPECGKRFAHKGHMTTHMRIHSEEKPFGCSLCDKKYSLKDSLMKHMRSHTGEKPFSCFECGKRFTQKCHLTQHLRTHTGEQPFSCSECGKRFKVKENMTKHMRIHLEEKPFGCSECGKCFTTRGNMKKHMKTHSAEKSLSALYVVKIIPPSPDHTTQ